MIDFISSFLVGTALTFYNIFYALTHPQLWLDWTDKQSLMRFIYYGGSFEFFSSVILVFIVLTAAGLYHRPIMWWSVRILEFLGNRVGRIAAWAGLLMVLQQIVIVFLQRIFRVSEISLGPTSPLGYDLFLGTTNMLFSKDLAWWAEELKFYNAIVICLCCGYTFIQGGHVRVDLFYAGIARRKKKIIDMLGSLFFMIPSMSLIWLYAWYFMWRHLITPKVSATDTLEALLRKSRIAKWNVETIGFSPSGFDAYFLFKVLLLLFAGLMFLQAIAFFYRSLLEYREGDGSDNKYLDKDVLESTIDDPSQVTSEIGNTK